MSEDYYAASTSRGESTGDHYRSEEQRAASGILPSERELSPEHPGYYEVEGEIINEADSEASLRDDGDDGDAQEIPNSWLRKPILSLSQREKADICRYKNMKPETSLRQMSEHFTRLWNKIVCRRSIYDVLIQNAKWTCTENRAYQDTEFTSENPVDDIESLLFDWIIDILRAEARVWDEDVRHAAAVIRDIRSLKDFVPSSVWSNGFKSRHKLETDPNDGSILFNALDEREDHPVFEEKRQIRIDIGEGLSYEIEVGVKTTFDAQREQIPPQSQFGVEPSARRGGPNIPPNRMTDSEILRFSDSDDEEEACEGYGFEMAPRDLGLEALLGSACSSSLHDILRHLIYGPIVMSEKAEEMMTAATEVALDAEMSGGVSTGISRERCERRAKLTADLVDRVLEAKRRRDEAERAMFQEKKLRDSTAFKVAEEKRKRYIERRELHMVQKKILETEERLCTDQQRNELIRRELLLSEDPSAAAGTYCDYRESSRGLSAKRLRTYSRADKSSFPT
ncbi:uncharacterized protein LOC100907589 [Galendromus occidentalis]|uniref:Uncharacterized protein LOC100907589 n=1 Tax=Galendromus occidentalis TaxID=34638 RepID=A0AAJ6QML9_9ACAR|nr:uncharacterized protein LOC100907589 [Galendromus occidentalis]